MRTKAKIKEKDFDTVKEFRTIKEKISKDIADMSLQQIQEYLKSKKVRPAQLSIPSHVGKEQEYRYAG